MDEIYHQNPDSEEFRPSTDSGAPQPGPDSEEIRPNPPRRRRKRSKWQDFKEAYLPAIIFVLAVVLIVTFIIGAVRRSSGSRKDSDTTSVSTLSPEQQLQEEQDRLLAEAAVFASQYDYQGAMNVLSSYSGGIETSQPLTAKYNEYYEAASKLVSYSDITQIPHLMVRMLIADLPRALADPDYGSSFNRNYITTAEFSAMLDQLYANGYILVSPYELAPSTTDGEAKLSQGTIYLPEGKKPLMLTQMGTNFFTYMVDSDGDGLPDKSGSGMPYRLAIDENGELTSQMIDAEGNDVSGDFDFVTILDSFIEAHPDFSYRNARATLAVTGYDGLFGYRIDAETVSKNGQEFYDEQRRDVVPVIEKLRAEGYDIACMSYDYMNYNAKSHGEITADLNDWSVDVKPLLGDVDILLFPYDDIGNENLYTGDKFDLLYQYGFRYFFAEKNGPSPWGQLTDTYARISYREVSGQSLHSHPEWYAGLFDAASVLQPERVFD